jgi:hypothetical protein
MKTFITAILLVATAQTFASDSAACSLYINNNLVSIKRVFHEDYDINLKGIFPVKIINEGHRDIIEYSWTTSTQPQQQVLSLVGRFDNGDLVNYATVVSDEVASAISVSTKINHVLYTVNCKIE